MAERALAISNNDIVHIAWSFDRKIPGCTGFSIFRIPTNGGPEVPLRSLPAFVVAPPTAAHTKAKPLPPHAPLDPKAPPALIKGFKWRDILSRGERGVAVKYRIVAMKGTGANPVPLPGVAPLVTNEVNPTPHYGPIDAYFNRGILSTQALANTLGQERGNKLAALKKLIGDSTGKGAVRLRLAGQLQDAVLSLLERRRKEGGDCFAALYELTDDFLIKALEAAKGKLHIVLSNNTGDDKKAYDAANSSARKRLAASGAELISRYLPDSRSIGHNKFMVYVDAQGRAQSVLTGSTNWTPSGLCTQNNNCIIVSSRPLAERYLRYWHDLKDDTVHAGIPTVAKAVAALQGAALRKADAVPPERFALDGGGGLSVWPSPNTDHLIPTPRQVPGRPPTPPDMHELFDEIDQAKQAVLFLVFQPGKAGSDRSWTIVKQLASICPGRPGLFVRGVISDEPEAMEFEGVRTKRMDAEVVAPAGIMKDVEHWIREIYKAGHAIVHDKIIVIDPFSERCVVATGSHNLGFKASYNNDENLLIVRGHRRLAEAYAAHIADVYEHYRWRWYNKRSAERAAARAWEQDGADSKKAGDKKYDPANFFQATLPPDSVGDRWQARYFDGAHLAARERQFWVGTGDPLPALDEGRLFTSGLSATERAFRQARAALRKKNDAAGDNG